MAKTTKRTTKKGNSAPAELKVFDRNGRHLKGRSYPTALPLSITNGDFLTTQDGLGQYHVGLFWNKSIFWNQQEWRVSGNFTEFEPGSMTEAQLYAFRRKWLKKGGHL